MAVTILPKGAEPSPAPAVSKYAKHLVSTPAKASFQVTTNKEGKVQHFDKPDITVHKGVVTEGAPAMVTVGGGQTISPKQYHSVKISVTLSMPSAVDSLDETFEFASKWVSEKMAALNDELNQNDN